MSDNQDAIVVRQNGEPSTLSTPPPPGRPELAKALATAQQKCRAVEKDAYNTFHRYHYASAEAIIAQAKDALAESGLALLPVEQTLSGFAREGEGRFELVRRFCLLHSSGEWMPISCAWPVCPEKGRPLDKATAIAATLSLSYLLRDLLLMPRVDPEDDAAARPDRPPAASAPPEKPAAKNGPTSEPPPNSDRLAGRLDELLRETGTTTETLAGWLVKAFGVNHWTQLGITQKQQVIAGLEKRAVEKERSEVSPS